MRRKPKLCISAAILLGFKLCVRLIEITRFAETTSAHAVLNKDFFPWCVLVYGERIILAQKLPNCFYNETPPSNHILRCGP